MVPGGALIDARSCTSPAIAMSSPADAVRLPLLAVNDKPPGDASASITEYSRPRRTAASSAFASVAASPLNGASRTT